MAEKGIYFCPAIQFLHEWFKTYPPTYVPEIHDRFPLENIRKICVGNMAVIMKEGRFVTRC